MKTDGRSPSAFGFLAIVEREPHGLFGGLLLLNLAGRPLEFHCTAPLKPNRAQQILYGPTLGPFLYGEHIGRALAQKCATHPLLFFVNHPNTLALRSAVDSPVCLVEPATQHTESALPSPQACVTPTSAPTWRRDPAHASHTPHLKFLFHDHMLSFDARWRADEAQIQARLVEVSPDFDLLEPFTRIEAAIDEAERASR
jgi:hypothetical protein